MERRPDSQRVVITGLGAVSPLGLTVNRILGTGWWPADRALPRSRSSIRRICPRASPVK